MRQKNPMARKLPRTRDRDVRATADHARHGPALLAVRSRAVTATPLAAAATARG
jgi:hypothetical protein